MQVQLQRAVAADRREESLPRQGAAAALGAPGHDAGWAATLNHRAAVQAQFALQRMLAGSAAAATQARLAQSLAGRAIQRATIAPGENELKRGAIAPASLLPEKSQCGICADAEKKDSKKKEPLQRQAVPATEQRAPGEVQVDQRP